MSGYRPRLSIVILIAANFALAPARAALQIEFPDWQKVEIKDRDLGAQVHILQGFGGNIGLLLTDEGVVMVDAEYPELSDKILTKIRSLSNKPLRYLVDTHFHWDHVGGNAAMARAGARIIASKETLLHIEEQQRAGNAMPGQYAADALALPTITVADGKIIRMGGETVEIYHIRHAHTDGDLMVRFVTADVIQTGDAFFNGFYPYIDVQHGGSIDQAIAFCDDLYALSTPRTRIIPGHGDITGREYINEYRTMLSTVRDRVAAAIAAGRSLDQIIAGRPLADLDAKWGGNLIKAPDFLEIVYSDLIRAKRWQE
jgi:cyclase